MKHLFYFLLCLTLICLLLTGAPVRLARAAGLQTPQVYLPILMNGSSGQVNIQTPLTLKSFIQTIQNGDASTVKGVFVKEILAQPVVQQPSGDYGYISISKEQVTQFSLAQAPVVGLIAHNDLAGEKFSKLTIGQDLYLVSGTGETVLYQIDRIASYRALDPASATSSFTDLSTGQILSAAQLFALYYLGDDHVTLQTCIAKDGNESWGRLMIVASPVH